MVNSYEQFLRIILSLYKEPTKPIVLKNVVESYDADSTVCLYTRAFNSSYRKLTPFFDENIDKIAKILEEDRLSKYYNSFIKDQEITNPE